MAIEYLIIAPTLSCEGCKVRGRLLCYDCQALMDTLPHRGDVLGRTCPYAMLSYQGKVVLAPMVRVGTLPMRLLALEYGADLVWSPEIVDKKIIGSERVFNARLGTYDYIKDGRTLVLRTHPREKERFIFQLGSADPELALEAAKTVARDVSGIDLNCGCPKHFSVHAGMGAALLKNVERLTSILRRLVTGLPELPISVKIRLLSGRGESMELISRVLGTGIKALTIHCRTPEERPRHPAHYEWIPEVVKMSPIPIIVNGDVVTREDIERVREVSGASSVMIARGAQWNASVFRREGMLEPLQVTQAYLRHAMAMDNPFSNTKYTVLQMWLDRPYTVRKSIVALQQAKSMGDLLKIFEVDQVDLEGLNEFDNFNQPNSLLQAQNLTMEGEETIQ